VKFNLQALLAGIVAALGFQPMGLWPLTLIACAFLIRSVGAAPRMRSALARGWWFGVGHFTIGLNWIATAFTFQSNMPAWLGWVAVVLLSLYLAIYPAMAAGLGWRYGRKGSMRLSLVLAAGWIVTEYLRATMFTGFAWNPLGVVLLPTFFSRTAVLVGTYGLSGLLWILAGALLLLFDRDWKRAAAIAAPVIVAGLFFLLLAGPPPPPTTTPLRIVQPNLGQEEKWREGYDEEALAALRRLSQQGKRRPGLLLWPEAAITRPLQNQLVYPYYKREAATVRRQVGSVLGAGDLLLAGGITWRSTSGTDVTSGTNSIFAMDRSGRILARYDKSHLVPYGEYLPMRPILSAIGLSRLAPGDIDFDAGPGPRTVDLPLVGKVGFQLCYEIVFSGEVVDPANRPNFLFNPSNDAWFGRWGPPQHMAQARMRALEEGLPVLRSTPTGISAVIDTDGRRLASLPWRQAGVIDARLPAPRPPTPFARLGNVLPLLLALLLGLGAWLPQRIAARRKAG
jgi:apolipoprotein N-acyltransferase